MKVEKYNIKRSDAQNKKRCNTYFCREASNNMGRNLILDSELLNTTEHLNMRDIPYSKIYIPNPFVYSKIKQKNKQVQVHNCLLGEFLNDTHISFNNAWFDYMCTLDGNATIKPIEDIEYYFKHQIHSTGAFAVTFSYRKRTATKFLHEDLSRTNALISHTAYKYGYTPIFCIHQIYKGMYFVLYKIIQNK